MAKTIRTALLLALTVLLAFAAGAPAVSYFPLVHHQPGDETARTPGQRVYLFHSGTPEVRAQLRLGDLLVVYRINRACEATTVGQVRVAALLGETYLEAEVIGGSVKVNDIAREGSVSCLVLAAEPCDRR